MDAFVSKASDSRLDSSSATAQDEPSLSLLATEIRAIRVSTQIIEQDTKEIKDIKATVEVIEGKISSLSSRMDEAEERVAELEGAADMSKQQVSALQEMVQQLQEHMEDLDNRRCCNVNILGLPELKEGNDMIQFFQQEIPIMLEHQFPKLEIQRAHRVPTGPPRREQRDGGQPRPAMVNFLRYQLKEEILRAAREKGQIIWQGTRLMFFPDFSRRTMERRASFKQVKLDLRNWGAEYTLRFPATLEIRGRPIYRPADILGRYMDFFQYRPSALIYVLIIVKC
uniref:L1 transposable element RRM domain-containing protein n=1 Tax=Amphiprion ocellaris TaxID=80972 RepID=A0A3Q1CAE9_AMPOC